jgi:long-chain acyl-CoA synthetase
MHDHWGRMLQSKAEEHKEHAVYAWKEKTTGKWEKQNWESFIADVENAALALIDLGIEPGDKVAIWSENMPQWLIADMAISMVRGVSVPLYANATVPQAEYILNESNTKVIFAGEPEQWGKAQELVASVPTLS